MRSAIGAGVSAYVVQVPQPERVQASIDVAAERFAQEKAQAQPAVCDRLQMTAFELPRRQSTVSGGAAAVARYGRS